MPSIIPGYDFTVKEVPTREKLALAATGLSISGLDASLIASDLIVEIINESSSVSLVAGGIRFSSIDNSLWVRTPNGYVKAYRGREMGLESNRYLSRFVSSESEPLSWNYTSNAGTTETNTYIDSSVAQNIAHQIRSVDPTAVSDSPIRTLLCGGSYQRFSAQTSPLIALQKFSTDALLSSGWPRADGGSTDDHVWGIGLGAPYGHPTLGTSYGYCWFAGPSFFHADIDG